nr:proton pump-interactor 1-like [Ipomoea batatas]
MNKFGPSIIETVVNLVLSLDYSNNTVYTIGKVGISHWSEYTNNVHFPPVSSAWSAISALTRSKEGYGACKEGPLNALQQALGKLRGNNAFCRDRGSIIFSSEAELNDYIKSLQYRIQHESITLNEEKQILREIKQIEGTREKVIANAAERAKIQESLGEKESIQSQVKVRQCVHVTLSAYIHSLFQALHKHKRMNSLMCRQLLITCNMNPITESQISFSMDRQTLIVIIHPINCITHAIGIPIITFTTPVDKFVAQWSSNKSFRDDYKKIILQSLDMRQLSKDGRMRNPDEKPLVLPKTPNVPAPEVVVKTTQKASKEDSAPPPQPDASLASKAQKDKNSKQQKGGKKKPSKNSLEVTPFLLRVRAEMAYQAEGRGKVNVSIFTPM